MDSTKRVLLAVVLSTLVMVFFNYIFPQAPAPKKEAVENQAQETVQDETKAQAVVEPPAVEPPSASEPTPQEVAVSSTTLGNDLLQVKLSNRGAAIVGAELKEYFDKLGPEAKPVSLLSDSDNSDSIGVTRLHNLGLNDETVFVEKEKSATRAVYSWISPEGFEVEKEYSLEPGNYYLNLKVKLINSMHKTFEDKLGILLVQNYSEGVDRYAFQGPAYFLGDGYEEVDLDDVKEGVSDKGKISWAAMMKKYFLTAVVPENAENLEFVAGSHNSDEKIAQAELVAGNFLINSGDQKVFAYKIYLGPKKVETLKVLGSNLEQVVNYGFFTVVAKPLQVFLKLIYSFIGNYGIAIILLTTLVKALFWPISAKGYRSMQRMKDLQPKLEKIKEKYGDDRERLSMEMMQLYKTHKVNPMGGCLPMLVQIPVFFALYRVLLTSIELRHAPFMFWIQDLSAPDRLFPNLGLPYVGGLPVLTLLMGGSMFLQQKLTPTAGAAAEPQMKMMMYGMPVIFTVMFLNFPSGLVLYWLVNNILGIVQQVMLAREAKAKKT